jgi:hypothetical protein
MSARTVSCPATLPELQDLVRVRPILAAGNLSAFTRPLALTPDSVTIEASMPVTSLLTLLTTRERAVSGLTTCSLTVREVLSTVAAQAIDAVFVLADGSLRATSDREASFPALLLSYGLLGVLYSVTLRTTQLTLVHQQRTFTHLPLDPVGWLRESCQRQVYFNPYTYNALLYQHSEEEAYGQNRTTLAAKLLKSEQVVSSVSRHLPFLIPRSLDLAYRVLVGRCSGPASTVLVPPFASNLTYEVGVPVDQAPTALARLQQLVLRWRDEQQYYLPSGILLHYRPADAFPLSIAYDVEVITFTLLLPKHEETQVLAGEVQELLGTRFSLDHYFPGRAEDHSGWSSFDLTRRLLDPLGKFLPQE